MSLPNLFGTYGFHTMKTGATCGVFKKITNDNGRGTLTFITKKLHVVEVSTSYMHTIT